MRSKRLHGGYRGGKDHFEWPDWLLELGVLLAYLATVSLVLWLLFGV